MVADTARAGGRAGRLPRIASVAKLDNVPIRSNFWMRRHHGGHWWSELPIPLAAIWGRAPALPDAPDRMPRELRVARAA